MREFTVISLFCGAGGLFDRLYIKNGIFYSVLLFSVLPHKPLTKWESSFLKAKFLGDGFHPGLFTVKVRCI